MFLKVAGVLRPRKSRLVNGFTVEAPLVQYQFPAAPPRNPQLPKPVMAVTFLDIDFGLKQRR
jgi:hypothetical protein